MVLLMTSPNGPDASLKKAGRPRHRHGSWPPCGGREKSVAGARVVSPDSVRRNLLQERLVSGGGRRAGRSTPLVKAALAMSSIRRAGPGPNRPRTCRRCSRLSATRNSCFGTRSRREPIRKDCCRRHPFSKNSRPCVTRMVCPCCRTAISPARRSCARSWPNSVRWTTWRSRNSGTANGLSTTRDPRTTTATSTKASWAKNSRPPARRANREPSLSVAYWIRTER